MHFLQEVETKHFPTNPLIIDSGPPTIFYYKKIQKKRELTIWLWEGKVAQGVGEGTEVGLTERHCIHA